MPRNPFRMTASEFYAKSESLWRMLAENGGTTLTWEEWRKRVEPVLPWVKHWDTASEITHDRLRRVI